MPTNTPTTRRARGPKIQSARRHTINSAIAALSRKADIQVTIHPATLRPVVTIQTDPKRKQNDLGNGSWGKLDFLSKRIGVRYGEF